MAKRPDLPPVVLFWQRVCDRFKVPVVYASIDLPDFRNRPVAVVFRIELN